MGRTFADRVRSGRGLRAIGFDDAPFEKVPEAVVPLCGIVCAGTRFEGMLWGQTVRDGLGATEAIAALLRGSKFLPQLHAVLLDGITVGGMNVIDLPALAAEVALPCIAVIRRPPDLAGIRWVVERMPEAEVRWARIERAGQVYELGGFTFQVAGAEPDDVAVALGRWTDRGRVPEPLRLAHLVGAAVIRGESSRRA